MMIGNGRKHISKWDKEIPEISIGDTCKNSWSRRAGMLAYAKDSESRQWLPEMAGSFKSKQYDFKANSNNGRELSDAMIGLHGDGNYSTKMSPGLDDWRQQNHKRSASGAWGLTYRSKSRSRSRTPSINLSPKLGTNNRDTRTKTCKYFSAGGCRNGDHCPYLHQYDEDSMGRREVEDYRRDDWEGRHGGGETSNYMQSDRAKEHFMRNDRSGDLCSYFLEGKCHKGALCNYNHQGATFDGNCKGSDNECFQEKEYDRANRHAAFDHHQDPGTFRSDNIPCKYFAAGNCRNGKFCKFSHYHQMRESSNARLQDGWSQESNRSGNVQLLRDTTHLDISELPEWDENRNGSSGVPELRGMVHLGNDRSEHSLDNQQRYCVYPTDCQRALESSDGEYCKSVAGNTGTGMGNDYRDVENRHGGMRNSRVSNYVSPKMLNNIVQGQCTHLNQASQPLTYDTFSIPCQQETRLGWRAHEAVTIQPMASENLMFQSHSSWREITTSTLPHEDERTTSWGAKSSIDLSLSARISPGQSQNENGQNSSTAAYVHSSSTAIQARSSINAVEQVRQVLSNTSREENSATARNPLFFQVTKLLNKPCLVDTNNSELFSAIQNRNIVSREQLSHLTSVAATLAQLLRDGQQVPQLHAPLTVSNAMEIIPSSVSDSAAVGSSLAATSVLPNSVFEHNKEYDLVCDSIEPKKFISNNQPAGFVSNCNKEKPFADQNLSPAFEAVPVDHNDEGHQLNKADQVANHDVEGSDGILDRERKKMEEDPLKKTEEDGGVNECKKNNNGRVTRAFKFALVECVKELLRPTWRDGQLSKEDHKTIVKKVVDKVTCSIQGAHIPQSQEKIDNYISSSRLKLSKLVQAYVEKYRKS